PERNATDFNQFDGTAMIKNGILSNNDLLLQAGNLKVAGKGIVNLVSQQLDYHLVANVVPAPTENNQMAEVQIPLLLRGTLNKPILLPDITAIAGSLLGNPSVPMNPNSGGNSFPQLKEKAAG